MKRNTNRLIKLSVVIYYIFMIIGTLFAGGKISNNNEQKSSGWLSFGIGQCYFGPTFNTSFSYSYKKNIFTIRYLKASEFRFDPGGTNYDDPALSLKEIGVLYGRSSRNKQLLFSILAGIGLVNGIDRGKQIEYNKYEKINISTFGIPLEAKFRIELSRYVGIGGSCFGNINTKKTFFGGMLELYLGKF
jgi:hypothetical protein